MDVSLNSEGGQDLGKPGRPLVEGLFALGSDPCDVPYLIGGKCTNCGKTLFPNRFPCPYCGERKIEEVQLSRKGVLYSYSIVHTVPPGSLIQPPFAAAIVDLPEGVQVKAVLADCDYERLTEADLGRMVELTTERVGQDEDGTPLISFKFRLV